MWSDLSDAELRDRLKRRLTGVAEPEKQIARLIHKRDDPEVAALIDEVLDR